MTDPKQQLSAQEIQDANLADWKHVDDTLQTTFATGDFATGLQLVNLAGNAAEEANHHPDITLTYPSVSFSLTSHDQGGLTSRDVDLARTISEHAEQIDVAAE